MIYQDNFSAIFESHQILFDHRKDGCDKYGKIIEFIATQKQNTAIAGGYFIKYNEAFRSDNNKAIFDEAKAKHDVDIYIFAPDSPDYSLIDSKTKELSANNKKIF